MFCNFHSSVNDRLIFDALNNLNNEFKSRVDTKNPFEEVCYSLIPSICIIDSTSLRVFTEKGEDFVTSLQFQIKSAWSTKYGILLEKEAMPKCQNSFMRHTLRTPVRNCDFSTKSFVNRTNVESAMKQSSIFSPDPFDRANSNMTELEIPLPTCFSLSHPLDEMAPTLIKSSHGIQYYNDGNMEIVFVSESPSLCLVYNNKSGLHSLYKIRKATHEECHLSCGNLNRTSTLFSQSTNFNFGENTPNFNSTIPRGNVPKNVTSSWLGGISSPFTSKLNHSNSSNLHSKNSNSMAGMFNKLGLTPHTSIGQASNSSMQTTNINRIEPIQPLYPDICFEHIWTENKISHATTAAAKKAFLHCDLIGQNYLCYLLCVGMKQLVIARLEKTHVSTNNVSNKQFIVGVVTSIQAKDAVNVPLLNMIAVIDLSGNIILYSGINMIGKVHIGGVLAGLINSPYNQIKKFDSPFPRRSSLLPMMSRDKPIDDPFHQLSPVPHSYGSHFATDKGFDSTGKVYF